MTKRQRFDVFKRDLFQCQYCGRTPPAVVLEVDHIKPQKQGKNDSMDNLITSCFDCNRGKAAVPLTEAPEALAHKVAVLKEKRDQLKAFDRFLQYQENLTTEQIEKLQEQFRIYYPGYCMSEQFCEGSLRRFLSQLNIAQLKEALRIAYGKAPRDRDRAIKYFCGICWNWIKEPGQHHG
jgi:hypothetical protein